MKEQKIERMSERKDFRGRYLRSQIHHLTFVCEFGFAEILAMLADDACYFNDYDGSVRYGFWSYVEKEALKMYEEDINGKKL